MVTQPAFREQGQTAIEYLLLLAAVVAIVLIGFNGYLPRINETANIYFNRVIVGVYGDPSHCGDGTCNFPYETPENCPPDCGCPAGCL